VKKLKFLLTTTLFIALFLSFTTVTYATDAITIDSVIFEEYVDEYGAIDESLVTVKVAFTAVSSPEQISLLLTSENISEISDTTKNKIIYMTQDVTPDDGIFEFAIEKTKVQTATGLTDINGCALFVKLGGKEIADMATTSVTYYDPAVSNVVPGDVDGDSEITNLDGTFLLRYLAGWELSDVQFEAMDVDDDGEITNIDGTFLLRYLAGWDIELK